MIGFEFDDFASAWQTLAGVTRRDADARVEREAQAAVQAAMWPTPGEPRHFTNTALFIIGLRR